MTHPFEDVSSPDICRFVADYPLAWIVPSADPSLALLMPLLIETDAAGAPVSLLGHLPRRLPWAQTLAADPSATCLFLGPHAYIPPGWISKPGWAPTWNFLSLKVSGNLALDDSLTRHAVSTLVRHMETRRGSDWTEENIGGRFEDLLKHIIGFRLQITRLTPRFKTGQDETGQSRSEIRAALAGHPLRDWMG